MRTSALLLLFWFCFSTLPGNSNLQGVPLSLRLQLPAQPVKEGQPITFTVVVTNNFDTPVLFVRPLTNQAAQRLFPISIYYRDSTLSLLRIKDHPFSATLDSNAMRLEQLKPHEAVAIVFEYNGGAISGPALFQRQPEIPLFAGEYGVRVTYSVYAYPLSPNYFYHDKFSSRDTLHYFPEQGITSNFDVLKIARTRDTLIYWQQKKYYIHHDQDRQYYWYYEDSLGKGSSINLVHMSSLPPDSTHMVNEYYYTHFTGVYAEFIRHYSNQQLEEYRRWVDNCPSEILEIHYYLNGSIYKIAQRNADNTVEITEWNPLQQIIRKQVYTADHRYLDVSDYIYDKSGLLKKIKKQRQLACVETEL